MASSRGRAAVDLEVKATGITASSKRLALAADEPRAKTLLDLGGSGIRFLLPAGSSLLAKMRAFGVPPCESVDFRIGVGTSVRSQAVITAPTGQDIEHWRESAQRVLERETADRIADAEERMGLPAGTLAVKFAPAPGGMAMSTECALDRLPKMEQVKQFCRSQLLGR